MTREEYLALRPGARIDWPGTRDVELVERDPQRENRWRITTPARREGGGAPFWHEFPSTIGAPFWERMTLRDPGPRSRMPDLPTFQQHLLGLVDTNDLNLVCGMVRAAFASAPDVTLVHRVLAVLPLLQEAREARESGNRADPGSATVRRNMGDYDALIRVATRR